MKTVLSVRETKAAEVSRTKCEGGDGSRESKEDNAGLLPRVSLEELVEYCPAMTDVILTLFFVLISTYSTVV